MFYRRPILAAAALVLAVSCVVAQTSRPPQTAPTTGESSNKKKPGGKHQHDFLIKGTVFTPEGLSLAGARIQIRKEGEKRFHWQDSANSRGEFAVRVVQGAKYEVVATGKGCKDQMRTVDATGSDRVEEVVFHMEREGNKPS